MTIAATRTDAGIGGRDEGSDAGGWVRSARDRVADPRSRAVRHAYRLCAR